MPIKALMVDVDGVLVDGRPQDGLPWQTRLEQDLGLAPETLHEHFFAPHWEDIVLGRAELLDHITPVLQKIAPHLTAATFLSYWFENDSRKAAPLLHELSIIRSAGIPIYLATNQEHRRATYLMNNLRLGEQVDGIFYSARLGAKKPDIEFFTRVQAAVGLPSEDILLIDDSRQNIEAARNAGWQALHWTKHTSPDILRNICAPTAQANTAKPSPPTPTPPG